MTKYIQIIINVTEEQQEILISELSEMGANGFEQTNNELLSFFDEDSFDKSAVEEVLKEFDFNINILDEQNWNEVWESNFQPVIVDDFCAIRAHFHEQIKNVKHELVITPKMSFGTGHHATTYMMIEQMRDIDFINKKVFDFGTGTGILAILAEKLGAASVSAVDVDEWSIENAEENILNNNSSKIEVSLSSNIPDENFDIILANINRNVILQYLPKLMSVLNNNSYILFSGLLATDEEDIVEASTKEGLQLKKQKSRNNWISLLFQNEK